MNVPIKVLRALSSLSVASIRRHSSLTRGLSGEAIRIFVIKALATGLGLRTKLCEFSRLSWIVRNEKSKTRRPGNSI